MKRRFVVLFLVCGLLFAWPRSTPAAAQTPPAPSDSPLDLVIVIDNSGSMINAAYGEADPDGLRYVAAKMLVDLVSEQDRVGFVHFASTVTYQSEHLTRMDSQQKRDAFKQQIEQARTNDEPGDTSYIPALQTAHDLFDSASNRRAVLFLTDGLPSDAALRDAPGSAVNADALRETLAPFQQAGIPVYLAILKNKRFGSIAELVPVVEQEFQRTGAPALQIDTPQDIARAFAFVLSQLQPNLYLDTLNGIADTGNTTVFAAHAHPNQAISQATFVFVPPDAQTDFAVQTVRQPENASVRDTDSAAHSYAVHSFESGDNQPIDGEWGFQVAQEGTSGFAFVRSDVRLGLVYPALSQATGQRVVLSNQPALVGVTISGSATDETASVEARLREGGCLNDPTARTGGELRQLKRVGLSPDNTLFWESISIAPGARPLALDIELKQLDKPLRLSRCFPIQALAGDGDGVQIVNPTPADNLEEGGLPLHITLPSNPDMTWAKVDAFVESPPPDQKVAFVPLEASKPQGIARGFNAPGNYAIRFVAQGHDAQHNAITLLAQTTYSVTGSISPGEDVIDLGSMTEPTQQFEHEIRLDAPLIQQDTPVSFQVVAAQRMDDRTDADPNLIDLCTTPVIEQGQVRCPFTITPPPDLAAGRYEVRVRLKVNDPEQKLERDTVEIRFERPASVLRLDTPRLEAGAIVPNNPYPTAEVSFQPYLWQGDPQLPTQLDVVSLRNNDVQETISGDLIAVELQPVAAREDMRYRLVVKPTETLPVGHYEARLQLASATPNLTIHPDELIVVFEKPGEAVDVLFTDSPVTYERPVWGVPFVSAVLPWFFPTTAYLPVEVAAQHVAGTPDLPAPAIVQIKRGNEVIDSDAIQFAWRSNGPVEGSEGRYHYTLVMQRVTPLPGGTYDVRLQMAAPIRSPEEPVVQMQVAGWGALFWWRLLPVGAVLLVLGLVVGNVRRLVSPAYEGTLIVEGTPLPLNGRTDDSLQLVLDEHGSFALQPDTPDSEVVIRCINAGEIVIDFKDGEAPVPLRIGDTLGNISYVD